MGKLITAMKSSTSNIRSVLFNLILTAISVCFSLSSFAEDIATPKIKIQTSLGAFTVELYPDKAPVSVKNFLDYVDEGFYVGTIFHRVVPNFAVQGGGVDFNFTRKKTRDPIISEASNKLKNETATLAMARTGDPNSATSQFFVNLKHNESLDYKKGESDGYTVFGKVIDGMGVIKKIEKEPRGLYRVHPEAPNYPVIIEAVERLN